MIVEKDHFAYLVNQHGRVAHERADFVRWKSAYEASLQSIYASITPALPHSCARFLDIGSGLGGIDVHLYRHYGGNAVAYLLDGLMDQPEVEWSFKTHNSMEVTFDFLKKNGVNKAAGFDKLSDYSDPPFDLVVSFAAYGFHIHPGNYLDDLMRVIHPKTVVILEVRKHKQDWLRMYLEKLGTPVVLERAEKYVRLAWRAQM